MLRTNLYPKDWLAIHPYVQQQPSDHYFVALANRLYEACTAIAAPDCFKKKISLYTAAYVEDVVSGLGLWQAFIRKHTELYTTPLPFYPVRSEYIKEELNEEDIRFIIWNTLQKAPYDHPFIHPMDAAIEETARAFFQLVEEAYETAPENHSLQGYFLNYTNQEEADRKLKWLFGHTYLTEPSVQEYIAQVSSSDKFIIPCGPLALFLHEWMELLTDHSTCEWKKVAGLYPLEAELSDEMKLRHRTTYELFTQATQGVPIVYLKGYTALKQFLTEGLQWPNDENHTLPQLKEQRNFILMVHPEKGILLAHDIAEYISDPLNPMYDQTIAKREAFSLLTVPTKCPPDLMEYLLTNHYIPDAQLPSHAETEWVQNNADFIARHSLLYYYRGD